MVTSILSRCQHLFLFRVSKKLVSVFLEAKILPFGRRLSSWEPTEWKQVSDFSNCMLMSWFHQGLRRPRRTQMASWHCGIRFSSIEVKDFF
jgi:hypothetical protein